ncbi:lytic transglycosylase domain-containing protein [Guyparkeria hydrothermalis]|uniref:lytic transglycosylase domain-containing protein n=1 Tax=Guyparkeria hydrothermalis TaxID=923 RepID=UPI0020205FF3|nr:lytic transglycosylase domain-containing protein [Guyparkeria hydrothermalis]MCL7743399.1 lytic transglycosylase domain-containing protein [Guyparkeria hydrothermalis]
MNRKRPGLSGTPAGRASVICRPAVVGALAVCLLLGATSAMADVYKYRDAQGVVHLTNVPQQSSNEPYKLWRKGEATKPKGWQDGYRVLPKLDRERFADVVNRFSVRHGVDPSLVRAVIHAESAFRPDVVSPKGAGGLMQLMPGTAKRFNVVDRFNPEENIAGGVAYLALLLKMFRGDRELAVAAYNAGENAVKRYGGIPPYQETKTYVRRVMQLQAAYAGAG